jgi:Family of unknown function (DUF6600)/FecR protein
MLISSDNWQKFTHLRAQGDALGNPPTITWALECKPEGSVSSLSGHKIRKKARSTMKRFMMIFLISLVLFPPVCSSASDLGGMRFSFIRGDVQIRTEDTGDWVPASINMPLREGDRIWVPEEGIAEIQTKDGSYLRLADRSALEILTLDRDSYQTYLTEGRLYAYFRGNRDSLLQIDTSSSSVRAHERSKFKVDVLETGPVNVSVLQGEVIVENRDGQIGVASGEMLSLGEGAYSEKSTLGSPDDWERWNWERDRQIAERRPPSRYLPEELQPYSDDFYDNGRWLHTPDYGYVWTPAVSVSFGWAPYRHGRWVWIGGDYVWVSYEPWGWVPYHYGRWFFAVSIGWCWVPPARGAVYWGPGYVGWVYTSNRVAWVPLAPREVYYGRGHHGPHSVDITTVNVTNVHVDKVVYKNVRVNNAVTTVDHNTFVRGRPADARLKENPFVTEKVHVGGPPIKPEKTSAMPVVREVPQTKKAPEPVRQVNVRELKERRPMVKSKEAAVFTQETRPGQMPVKEGGAKPAQKKSDRVKELRQPSKRTAQPSPSAPAEKQVGQPTPSGTKLETPKERGKSEGSLERTRHTDPAPTKAQEQKQRVPTDKRSGQLAPSEPAVRTPKEATPQGQGAEKPGPTKSPSVDAQEKAQERPAGRGVRRPAPAQPDAGRTTENRAAPPQVKEQKERMPNDRGLRQAAPSEPALRTPPETRTPARGTDRRMENRSPERGIEQTRPPEKVQPKSRESAPSERGIPQAPEPGTPDKRTDRSTGPRNPGKGA